MAYKHEKVRLWPDPQGVTNGLFDIVLSLSQMRSKQPQSHSFPQ